MSSPLALRRFIALLAGYRTADECRRALGLDTLEELERHILRAAKAGAVSIDRELAAQTPAEDAR